MVMGLLGPSLLHAAPMAVVESLQLPAWVEHNGIRAALAPGMILSGSDTVATGAGARILIRMADGSHIKLGENATLRMTDLRVAPQGILHATLNVIIGAFRFTTSRLARQRKRNILINIVSLSVGVRGTDVWGKAASDKNILCLIDGRVSVRDHANNKTFIMAQALTFYIAPHDQPPLPVQPVSRTRLQGWARQVELLKGHGILAEDGTWVVHLLSRHTRERAEGVQQELVTAGYPAVLAKARIDDDTYYRVSVAGFKNKKEAKGFRRSIKGKFGITKPWISQRTL